MDQTSTLITAVHPRERLIQLLLRVVQVKVALKDMDKDSKAHAAKVVIADLYPCVTMPSMIGREGW